VTNVDEYLFGAPDNVIEVLSPSNTAIEINDKRSTCLENGCSSFWVVDPRQRTISVTEGDVTRHYGETACFSCDALGATISVREIFE
jgi:Uma2 family endonuclease